MPAAYGARGASASCSGMPRSPSSVAAAVLPRPGYATVGDSEIRIQSVARDRAPAWLMLAIVDFAALHPRLSQPSYAYNKCQLASGQFCDFVAARHPRARLFVDEVAVVDGVTHRAALVGLGGRCGSRHDWLVDWTARQFIRAADFPVVCPEARW
jgi:hypothetical protein